MQNIDDSRIYCEQTITYRIQSSASTMQEEQNPILQTKYAHFSRTRLQGHPSMVSALERQSELPSLHKILWQDENWEVYEQELDTEYQAFLGCMTDNFALTIDFKYLLQHPLIAPIKFHRLQELRFSVDSDSTYLDNIEFLAVLHAPNLRVLDISNCCDGSYSMRPLRKAYFPQLLELDISLYFRHGHSFYDINTLSEGYFPELQNIVTYQTEVMYVDGDKWQAKMESRHLRKELEDSVKAKKQKEGVDKLRKRIKSS